MLGTGPHFPLGMIAAHVTRLASLWVLRFFQGKGMPGMTYITRIVLVAIPYSHLIGPLLFSPTSHVMATTKPRPLRSTHQVPGE